MMFTITLSDDYKYNFNKACSLLCSELFMTVIG